MRALTKHELDLVAGGTTSSDYYPGSSGTWYEGGGAYSGGGTYDAGGMWIYYAGRVYTDSAGAEVIVANQWYYYSYGEVPVSGSGGGGGGSGAAASNTDYTVTNDDAPCENGAAIAAATQIQGLVNTVGSFEFTGLLGLNSNGSYGLLDNELSTMFSPTDSTFDARDSYANVYGVVHNHPPNPSDYNENFLNRYPSDRDWETLQILIDGGANPNNLSVFIIDPFGTMREFAWNDRDLYKNMTDAQRYDVNGPNLPNATTGCPSTGG